MTNMKDPQTTSSYIQCLSALEDKICHLYKTMADKIDMPLASGFLYGIAQDSLKHSKLLKNLSNCVAVSEKKIKLCEKKLLKTTQTIDSFYTEIQVREKIMASDFPRIAENLAILECSFSEEYTMLTKIAFLQPLVQEINEKYYVTFEEVQLIFEILIAEKKQHITLLETVKTLLDENFSNVPDAPSVRFQNPDRWSQSLPSTA